MQTRHLALGFALLCCAGSAHAASLEKAQALFQNGLLDDAKKELIDLIYSTESAEAQKPAALYLLAKINIRQGNTDVAVTTLHELVDRYPQRPESELARQQLRSIQGQPSDRVTAEAPLTRNARVPAAATPEVSMPWAPSAIHLSSDGQEPRFTLLYSASAKPDHMDLWMRSAVLNSDCPAEPSKLKYPTSEVDMRVVLSPESDDDPRVLRMHLTGTLVEKTPNDQHRKAPKPTLLDSTVRMLPSGQVIAEMVGSHDEVFNTQLVFPNNPVGVGASWDEPTEMVFAGKKVAGTVTYSVQSIDAQTAQLHVTNHFSATLTDKEETVLVEGGGEGALVWRARHFMPASFSNATFVRATQMNGPRHDRPGKIVCVLTATGAQ